MNEIFAEGENVRAAIHKIREATKAILEINNFLKFQADKTDVSKSKEIEVALIISKTNAEAKVAKETLVNLREQIKNKLKNDPNVAASDAEIRIRENLLNTMIRKFADAIKEYQTAQSTFNIEHKKKERRHYLTAFPDLTEDQLDELGRKNISSEELMKERILNVSK